MHAHLPLILARLGMPSKPRFTLEEVADILGIRRDQVLSLLKRGKLIGIRAMERRWAGVFAEQLATYLEEVNAPKAKPKKAVTKAGATSSTVTAATLPAPSKVLPVLEVPPPTPIPPPAPSTPSTADIAAPDSVLVFHESVLAAPVPSDRPRFNF
jgi:hypothetical protein